MKNINILDKLNTHMNLERATSAQYIQISTWFEDKGLKGCSKFFFSHSKEETTHFEKIFHFLLQNQYRPKLTSIEEPKFEFNNVKEIFEFALKSEKEVTRSINDLSDVSLSSKDLTSFTFLQWFIAEQLEEEDLFSTILTKIEYLGIDSYGVNELDKYLDSLSSSESK